MFEYAGVLANFPLLDRDQPWLPGDGFIAYDKKGKPKFKPRSFITRDKVLLEYFRLLGETPPDDIVAFFAEAGVDIDGGKVLAGEPPADPFNPPICATGPIRNLEERVVEAEKRGAIGYVPSVRGKWIPDGPFRPPDLPNELVDDWDNEIKQYIHSDGAVLGGKRVFCDTRIAVSMVQELFANNWTFAQIKKSYPHLSDQQIAVAWYEEVRQ
ncbi:MAG: DUF433 domain-containing protein [Planctomycetes bacterium]|nr:DUF433 domain-containing protein [Planctomycetota bacterium]